MVHTKAEDLQRCELAQLADLHDEQPQHRGAKHGDQFLNAHRSIEALRKMVSMLSFELAKTLLDTNFLQLVQQFGLLEYREHHGQLLSEAHDQARQTLIQSRNARARKVSHRGGQAIPNRE